MPEAELFLLFVRPFNRAGIRYVLSGSVAAIFYGEPRLTNDVDFVAFLNEPDIRRLPEIFPPPDFYLPPLEAIAAEVARDQRGQFNIIHVNTSFKADVYLTGRDEFNAWAFRNKRRIEYEGETMVLAPPEYVIVRKLEFYREGGSDKHLRDIRAMLKISGEKIDRGVIEEWVNRQGMKEEWDEVLGAG
jgi:hypothetical protein